MAVAVALSLLAVGFGPGVAAAQSGNETVNETGVEEEVREEVNETISDNESEEIEAETPGGTPIDSEVTLTDWSYSEGTFTLSFEHTGERPKTVSLTEATQPEEGAQQLSVQDRRLLPGETTMTITTKISGGNSAVSITTSDSIANGTGVVVSTGKAEEEADDPFSTFGGTSGLLTGVGGSVIMSALAALWVVWREESGVIRA